MSIKADTYLKLAVLGSGAGSNMQSILDAIAANKLAATVVCTIADVADAKILERAKQNGIPAYYVDPAPYKTKLDGQAEEQVIELLKKHNADTVVLAGFMRIIKPRLLSTFPYRVLNIHPSLLPAFPGLRAWEQAITYGAKVTGCTVHFVDQGMDTGPIILQRCVNILENDTPATLHSRIQEQEHTAFPAALQLLAKGRLVIEGRKVIVR